MSTIDLTVLGMVAEKPQSAYDLQKDVAYHHLSRWTNISVPSIYRKVLQLSENGYLQGDSVKGNRAADKVIYSITDKGREYFTDLMKCHAAQPVPLCFDFNTVIANLNKLNKRDALDLIAKLKESLTASARTNEAYLEEYADIPLVGRTIIEQQRLLYNTILAWLDAFREQFEKD